MNDGIEYGYLIVNTRTAQGAVPVEDAQITVTDMNGLSSRVVSVSKTNRSGSTVKIRLPVTPYKNAAGPSAGVSCVLYTIDADKEGYYPVRNVGVQIYSGITSVQPVEFIPCNISTTRTG